MSVINVKVENLKCHGCANTITKGLLKENSIENVKVNVADSVVSVTYIADSLNVETIKSKLSRMGYPESGDNNTLSVAKSFLSCAVGRMNK